MGLSNRCLLFWNYLLAVINVAILPVPFPESPFERQPAAAILSRVNLVPGYFGGLFDLNPKVIYRELGGNILLTVPFGFGLPFMIRIQARRYFWLAVLTGISIETLQLFVSLAIGIAYRGVDINDVLLNASGVLFGYAVYRGLHRVIYSFG